MKDALQLLDNPRLGFPKKVGHRPRRQRRHGPDPSHLPLSRRSRILPFEKVQLTADAKIEDARLGKIFLGHDLTEGNFDLKLDSKGMGATGTAKLAGIPAGLRWELHFYGEDFTNAHRAGGQHRRRRSGAPGLRLSRRDQRAVAPRSRLHGIQEPAERGCARFRSAERGCRRRLRQMEEAGRLTRPCQHPHDSRQEAAGRYLGILLWAGDFSGRWHVAASAPDGKLAEATFDQARLSARPGSMPSRCDFGEPQWDIHIGGGVFDAEPFIGKSKAGLGRGTAQPAANAAAGRGRQADPRPIRSSPTVWRKS